MNLYTYDGPVTEFGTCVKDNWKASTFAVSEKKAKSNLAYQYKKEHKKLVQSKINLPGKIIMVD